MEAPYRLCKLAQPLSLSKRRAKTISMVSSRYKNVLKKAALTKLAYSLNGIWVGGDKYIERRQTDAEDETLA